MLLSITVNSLKNEIYKGMKAKEYPFLGFNFRRLFWAGQDSLRNLKVRNTLRSDV